MADIEFALNAYTSGDASTAIKILKELSKENTPEAGYYLGKIYASGKLFERNIDEALHWFMHSANLGYASSQYSIGNMYHKGISIEKDFKEARKWFLLAAEQQNTVASSLSTFTLGTMHLYGEGVPDSQKEAEAWFESINDGSPRNIISMDFDSIENELPIYGGWGYTKNSACIIDKSDPSVIDESSFDGVEIEHIFVEKRIYEEMIVTRPIGEAYSGIKWNLISQELIEENDRYFDHMVFSVSAFRDKDWNALSAEWEGRHDNPLFSLDDHNNKREKLAVHFTREFWFDITSFYGQMTVNKAQKQLNKANEAFKRGDYATALVEIRQLAEDGISVAQYNLGLMYENAQGVPQDHKEAVKWFRKAAEQGDSDAQAKLAGNYAMGQGVKQDFEEAARWCIKAAEQGHPKAQINLGNMYIRGLGVKQDHKKAINLFEKAAEQGLTQGLFNIGMMHRDGDGVPQDYKEAMKWFMKAAEQGEPLSQSSIGVMYYEGDGVEKDYVQSYMWFHIAALNGNQNAENNITVISEEMNAKQILEARNLAKEWLDKYQ